MASNEHAGGREDAAPVTAADKVAHELAEIVLKDLAPGASLPSESELARRFEVSRLTVREAIRTLSGRGLIDVSRGRRAIVTEPSGTVFSDFLAGVIQADAKGIFDLIELRMSLEVQSATLAARRATRAGLTAIAAALDGMREANDAAKAGEDRATTEPRFHAADATFHEAVALSSGNRLISYLFEAMSEPLRQSFFLSSRGHDTRGHTFDDTITAHQAIFDAIQAGSAKGAAAAMRHHLEETERDIRIALGSSPRPTR